MTFFGTFASADDILDSSIPTLPVKKIEAALDRVLQEKSFPPIDYEFSRVDLEIQQMPKSDNPLSEETVAAFSNVMKALGVVERAYRIRSTDLPDMIAYNDVKHMTIDVNAKIEAALYGRLSHEDRLAANEFVLAHEISHYIVDFYAQKISSDSKSPSGFLVPPKFFDPYKLDVTKAGIQKFMVDPPGERYIGHAEIDIMAILILRKMGKTDEQVGHDFRFFSAALSNQPLIVPLKDDSSISIDFNNLEKTIRLKTIAKAFNSAQ